MNLKFKKSYIFIHTSSNSKRDRQRGRERKRKKSKSKTSLANPLLIWKTTITKTHDRSITGLHDHHDQNPWLIHHRSPWPKLHWSHGCHTHTHTHTPKQEPWLKVRFFSAFSSPPQSAAVPSSFSQSLSS